MNENDYSTNELLIRLGQEVVATRKATQWIALFATIQFLVLALWIFGVITIGFEPV